MTFREALQMASLRLYQSGRGGGKWVAPEKAIEGADAEEAGGADIGHGWLVMDRRDPIRVSLWGTPPLVPDWWEECGQTDEAYLARLSDEFRVSQTRLARDCGVNRSALSMMVAGRRRLTPAMANAVLLWIIEHVEGPPGVFQGVADQA